ncbi:hypothetical protein BU16DRAFT_231093 [Lophium mytilinum]|uniref:Uncharacterized protein n=1 Tax=Lophium mytilinum TaxID=390894 RepID=A0A6A6Q8C5_9PEZI|nr:hypothetical protein BU16DRAFT_231093 [Lophium mytilinum]
MEQDAREKQAAREQDLKAISVLQEAYYDNHMTIEDVISSGLLGWYTTDGNRIRELAVARSLNPNPQFNPFRSLLWTPWEDTKLLLDHTVPVPNRSATACADRRRVIRQSRRAAPLSASPRPAVHTNPGTPVLYAPPTTYPLPGLLAPPSLSAPPLPAVHTNPFTPGLNAPPITYPLPELFAPPSLSISVHPETSALPVTVFPPSTHNAASLLYGAPIMSLRSNPSPYKAPRYKSSQHRSQAPYEHTFQSLAPRPPPISANPEASALNALSDALSAGRGPVAGDYSLPAPRPPSISANPEASAPDALSDALSAGRGPVAGDYSLPAPRPPSISANPEASAPGASFTRRGPVAGDYSFPASAPSAMFANPEASAPDASFTRRGPRSLSPGALLADDYEVVSDESHSIRPFRPAREVKKYPYTNPYSRLDEWSGPVAAPWSSRRILSDDHLDIILLEPVRIFSPLPEGYTCRDEALIAIEVFLQEKAFLVPRLSGYTPSSLLRLLACRMLMTYFPSIVVSSTSRSSHSVANS